MDIVMEYLKAHDGWLKTHDALFDSYDTQIDLITKMCELNENVIGIIK